MGTILDITGRLARKAATERAEHEWARCAVFAYRGEPVPNQQAATYLRARANMLVCMIRWPKDAAEERGSRWMLKITRRTMHALVRGTLHQKETQPHV